ncbi:cytochrome b N-terminal domain-containing protein [Desulfosporosinus sp.]|uniref:cytochrome b N-terminal domain-containing protein n=1 Tax=Desulfosporosinus sp. TaxID=157907 RepID=UPI0025BF368F|nr:cytochrome b N-terminal domain-containing protein [Desulfosporosinus sp.]MBC2723443.1 cytochrome b N-terminal domain-containing protein [Desulfosporosinus sp.]MBC2725034.1 cytochrome b N-terminal domain-containing protein [Desulfosporosinus sp.]
MGKQGNNSFMGHIRPRQIMTGALRLRATFCLGGFSFLAFLVLTITGVLLLFFYQPGDEAFISLSELNSVLPYGGVIRSLHFWAAQMMVISVFLHMVRVVWSKAYRPLRELNWITGVVLFVLTVILDYSGYLLRGGQESGAAATIGQALFTSLPGGQALATIFFGQPSSFNGSTLNMYAWHVFILPGVLGFLQMVHFWRIRRDGGVRPL